MDQLKTDLEIQTPETDQTDAQPQAPEDILKAINLHISVIPVNVGTPEEGVTFQFGGVRVYPHLPITEERELTEDDTKDREIEMHPFDVVDHIYKFLQTMTIDSIRANMMQQQQASQPMIQPATVQDLSNIRKSGPPIPPNLRTRR